MWNATYLCGTLDVLGVAANETGLLVVVVGHCGCFGGVSGCKW